MLLASMQQAEATRAEPVFAVLAQKFRSFLLSMWAILQTTKRHEINTFECVHFYFLYPCSPHLREIGTSCLAVISLEYFVASRQWTFFFELPFKDDRHDRDHTYCTKTKKSHILKQTCSWKLQVYLSICDLLMNTRPTLAIQIFCVGKKNADGK